MILKIYQNKLNLKKNINGEKKEIKEYRQKKQFIKK